MSYVSTYDSLREVSNVTSGQKLVLAMLATYERAGKCWPNNATLAAKCRMSARSVQRHLAKLVSYGYLKRIYRSGESAITILNVSFLNAQAKNAVDTSGTSHNAMVATQAETATATQTIDIVDFAQAPTVVTQKAQQSRDDCLGMGGTCRQAGGATGDGLTYDNLSYPPMTTCHPESVIPESVNEITAAPAAVSPPLFVSEIHEHPETAIEPSYAVDGTVALPESVQAVVEPSDASMHEAMANEMVDVQVDTLAIDVVVDQTDPMVKVQMDPKATDLSDPLAEVPKTLLEEWGQIRKFKKKTPKPVKTEVQILAQEAAKAGLTVADVVYLMVTRGWTRFQAGWIAHVPPQAVTQGPQAVFKPEVVQPASPGAIAQFKANWARQRAEMIAGAARRREEQMARRR